MMTKKILTELHPYVPIIVMFVLSLGLSLLLLILSYFLAPRKKSVQKLSIYECGFDSYGDARIPFDVHYYLVAILFIIFDLEIVFLFPWVICVGGLEPLGFWSMVTFLLILTGGFVYEYQSGALIWK